jgi:TolB-like protein
MNIHNTYNFYGGPMTSKYLLFFFLSAIMLAAQTQPMTAVMPFKAQSVSESDAAIITSMFETALVQTQSFLVIEQNQVEQILAAQSYNLTGCTDESCAVEFGKLLAAEQIILGEVSRLGGSYHINAKIIDVELGRNIRAETVSASSIDGLSEQAGLLAFKLAGLTYSSGGDAQIAREFGEVFVSTDPAGAMVYINGVPKGESPDLFQRVPIGSIVVEARKDNLYARQEVDVQRGMSELTLELKETFGNLYIKSDAGVFEIQLDGSSLAYDETGLYRNLPAGGHMLTLEGDGLAWEGEIEILEDESTVVEPLFKAYGELEFSLPQGAVLSLQGNQGNYRFEGQNSHNKIRIWAGRYNILVEGEGFQIYEDTLVFNQGEVVDFNPPLSFSEVYYQNKLEEIQQNPESSTIEEITNINDEITAAGFTALISQANEVMSQLKTLDYQSQLSEMETKLSELEIELTRTMARTERIPQQIRSRKTRRNIFLGSAIASAAFTGVSYFLMSQQVDAYNNADSTSATVDAREQAQLWANISIGSAGAAGVFSLMALTQGTGSLENQRYWEEEKISELRDEIAGTKATIAQLNMQLSQM